MTDMFDELADELWELSPLEKLWESMGDLWKLDLDDQTYRLKDKRTGALAVCRICDKNDGWKYENDNVFVCEHEPIWVGRGYMRQLDSMPTRFIQEMSES